MKATLQVKRLSEKDKGHVFIIVKHPRRGRREYILGRLTDFDNSMKVAEVDILTADLAVTRHVIVDYKNTYKAGKL